jgi:hypothetical protein
MTLKFTMFLERIRTTRSADSFSTHEEDSAGFRGTYGKYKGVIL